MPAKKKSRNSALPSSISSRKLIRILRKLGAQPVGRSASGTHEMWVREENGKKYLAPVILSKKDIPGGTLRSILRGLNISVKDCSANLGIVVIIVNTIKFHFFGIGS